MPRSPVRLVAPSLVDEPDAEVLHLVLQGLRKDRSRGSAPPVEELRGQTQQPRSWVGELEIPASVLAGR